jgi:hypothetical protein
VHLATGGPAESVEVVISARDLFGPGDDHVATLPEVLFDGLGTNGWSDTQHESTGQSEHRGDGEWSSQSCAGAEGTVHVDLQEVRVQQNVKWPEATRHAIGK